MTKPLRDTDGSCPHLQVSGRFLFTPDGERVVLRGVNEMFVWGDRGGDFLPEIAKAGANSVRLVWTVKDGSAHELDALVARCAALGMIPIVEFHDATGKWEELETVVAGWLRPDYLAVIQKHEPYLILNIGNEVGQDVSDEAFFAGYCDAVARLRLAGVRVPLMIDPAQWGKDYGLLSRNGQKLLESDPLGNLLFSIHMWWPAKWSGGTYQAAQECVITTLADSVDRNLPLVVGEFGAAFSDAGDVQEEDRIAWPTILEECARLDVGWLVWSWGGVPNKPQTDLDMTRDGTFAGLHGWGKEVVLGHTNGLSKSARPCAYLKNLSNGFSV